MPHATTLVAVSFFRLYMKRAQALLPLLCFMALLSISDVRAVQYRAIELGTAAGYVSYYCEDVNDRGQVVGRAYTSTNASSGFVWDAVNGMRILEGTTYVNAINNDGLAVVVAPTGPRLWDEVNGLRSFESNYWVTDINDQGQVAGGNPASI